MQTKAILILAAVLANGLFSGSMLFIAGALVPFWGSLAPEAYRTSFHAVGPSIGGMMVPLMLLSIALNAACSLVGRRVIWVAATVLVVLIVPLYATVHAPANAQLLGDAPLAVDQIVALRQTWFFWHGVRTLLGIGAFALTITGALQDRA